MSIDPIVYVNDASGLIQIVILAVGIARVAEMRRAFVDVTYRSRAAWSALLMFVIAVTNAESLIPLPNGILGALIGTLPFLAIIGVSYGYVDRTVVVAIRSDFFHRNILNWTRVRIPLTAIILVSLASGLVAGLVSVPESQATPFLVIVAFDLGSGAAAVVLGFGAVAIAISARRTRDRALRRNIRLLGLALAFFVASLAAFVVLPPGDASSAVGDILTVFATYFLYLSTMSLSPLGHVENEVAVASQEPKAEMRLL
jgi:hypothetical protein